MLLRAGEVALALEHGGEDHGGGYVFGIERYGLAKLIFSGSGGCGIGALEEAEGGVEGGAVGIDGKRLLNLGERLGAVAFVGGDGGEERVGVGVVALKSEDGVGLVGGFVGLLAGEKKIAEVDAGRDVAGLEIDDAHEISVGGHERALLEIDLGELVVGVGEVAVDLEGVLELDGGFLELALVGVALAAVEISLLDLVRVAMAAQGETKGKRDSQDAKRRSQ